MAHVLVIDDDPDFCYGLKRVVSRLGHSVITGSNLAEARQFLAESTFEAVFLDVQLPDGNGLSLLGDLGDHPSQPETIIITGAEDAEGAEIAITNGAWDYINKATSPKDISLTLKRALQYRHEKLQAAEKTETVALRRDAIIGTSPSISSCFDKVAQCAASDVNVVITGETGTGKELFAQVIHDNSQRSGAPFVIVDCASLPETLAESILFGHKKGAFTGADTNRKGLVTTAHTGTLFLDEIGELPPSTQKTFLRVLQERTVRAVGSQEESHCDFRLVAATNRDLEEMVEEQTFRRDLFFRIQSAHIQLPPLRNRQEDIGAIATYHINRLCDQMNSERKGVSSAFLESLSLHDWPGNVRELVNCIEQAIVSAGWEPTLYPKHLPVKIRIKAKHAAMAEPVAPQAADFSSLISAEISDQTLQQFRDQVYARAEHQYLSQLMASTEGKIQKALKISGLSQSRLYALLKKYNLRPGSKKEQ